MALPLGYTDEQLIRNSMIDPSRRSGPNVGAVQAAIDTGNAQEGQLRPEGEEIQAATNVGLARDIAASDPLTAQLRDTGSQAAAAVDPAKLEAIRHRTEQQAGAATAQQLASRASQQPGIHQLGRLAQGHDSVVMRQAHAAREAAQRQIGSQLASSRGGFNPALQRSAIQAAGRSAADIGQQAAIGAAQERRAALGQQLAALQGQRASDLQSSASAMQQGVGLGQLQSGAEALRQQQLVNALQSGAQTRAEFYNQLGHVQQRPRTPGVGELLGSTIGGLGGTAVGLTAAIKSDERSKEAVKPDRKAVDSFLGALSPQSWRYKKGHVDDGAKRHTGVMAQALERSALGRQLVFEGGDGYKRVDYHPAKTGPLIMAALASINKRLKKVGG